MNDPSVWSGPEAAKASEALNRRARQRDAAARAQQELTPEAIAAEEERQRRNAELAESPVGTAHTDRVAEKMKDPEYAAAYEAAREEISLSEKLAAAVQPVIDETGTPVPDLVGVGSAVFQWAVATSEDPENQDGYQLVMQVQVDDQAPGGASFEITREMLDRWRAGVGLQGNRVEHKRFAAGLVEKAIELASLETGNNLIYTLEQLMLDPPTETSVGDDFEITDPQDIADGVGPFEDAPENADEVPE